MLWITFAGGLIGMVLCLGFAVFRVLAPPGGWALFYGFSIAFCFGAGGLARRSERTCETQGGSVRLPTEPCEDTDSLEQTRRPHGS